MSIGPSTRGQIVYMVSYYLALTSCTRPWVDPSEQAFMKDSRSQRMCAWLYLHGISRGKMRICGCLGLGLELGMGVPANEQGPLGRRKHSKRRHGNDYSSRCKYTKICCIVYLKWVHCMPCKLHTMKLFGSRWAEEWREGWPAEQTGWQSVYSDVLIGGSRSRVSRAHGTIISTLLDIWKLL